MGEIVGTLTNQAQTVTTSPDAGDVVTVTTAVESGRDFNADVGSRQPGGAEGAMPPPGPNTGAAPAWSEGPGMWDSIIGDQPRLRELQNRVGDGLDLSEARHSAGKTEERGEINALGEYRSRGLNRS